jgi:hypothetical protein
MADSAPALLTLCWMHGQFYLGAAGDVFQDKTFAADDGLNKFLGSHWGTFFYDSLSDNKIIVVSSLLPKACSVFSTHTFYR